MRFNLSLCWAARMRHCWGWDAIPRWCILAGGDGQRNEMHFCLNLYIRIYCIPHKVQRDNGQNTLKMGAMWLKSHGN